MAINWALVSILTTILLSIGSVVIWLIERLRQAEARRFEATEKKLAHEVTKREELERELRGILTDLPNRYVQREDWIRLATTIEAKMDRLGRKFDELRDRLYERN